MVKTELLPAPCIIASAILPPPIKLNFEKVEPYLKQKLLVRSTDEPTFFLNSVYIILFIIRSFCLYDKS